MAGSKDELYKEAVPCIPLCINIAPFQATQSADFAACNTAPPPVAAFQHAMGPTGVTPAIPPTVAAANVNPARPAYKYTSNMRNPPEPQAVQQFVTQQAVAQQAIHIQGQEHLANANAQELKQMIGNSLYPVIHHWFPNLAAKITQLLLEIELPELIHILKHHELLKEKLSQLVNSGNAGYFVPTMPQTQRSYFPQIPKMRATPRWPAQHQMRPGAQPAAAFQAMQSVPFTAFTTSRPAVDSLTASMLADANAQEQKQKVVERLFPVIHCWYPNIAGKITKFLLDIDTSELLVMLEHHELLKAKVEEAVAVLQVHHAKETLSFAGGIKKEG